VNPLRRILSSSVCLLITLVLLATSGCNSHNSRERAEERTSDRNSSQASAGGSGPGINLNCVFDRIQNPPEAFHYSYKKSGDNVVDQQADITPQSIDGSFTNDAGTQLFHGVRSDQQSWQSAMAGITGISGMSSTVALVNHGSAMVREGNEKVNGYDTIRYSIDTSRGDAAEAALYRNTLGPGGFEKGTAWVTDKGCPVKISLDSELHLNNGSVDKVHYEEAMVKK